MFTNLHEQEEADFGRGPLLWDAGDVCCAAFQLGACIHTEGHEFDDEGWDGDLELGSDLVEVVGAHVALGEEDEPF